MPFLAFPVLKFFIIAPLMIVVILRVILSHVEIFHAVHLIFAGKVTDEVVPVLVNEEFHPLVQREVQVGDDF